MRKQQTTLKRAACLLVLSMMLFACDSNSNSVPTAVNTLVPVAGSAANVETADIPLTQTARLRNGNGDSLTVRYPGNWLQGENLETILLANAQSLVDGSSGTPASGEVGVSILAFRKDFAKILAGQEDTNAISFLQAFVANTGEDAARFTSLQPYLLNGQEAARVFGQDDATDAVIHVLRLDGAFVLLVGATNKGELNDFEPTMQAILASVNFEMTSTPALTLEPTATQP